MNINPNRLKSILLVFICVTALPAFSGVAAAQQVPVEILLRITRAEDTRDFNGDLKTLLRDKRPEVRRRAALAAGRIGDELAVAQLASMMQEDSSVAVREMAAFALGEIESLAAADGLISAADHSSNQSSAVRARAVEALGKIAAAVPKAEEARAIPLREAILKILEFEHKRRAKPDNDVVLLSVTAILRARPDHAGPTLAPFLRYSDPRIRADTANTLARLKLNDGNNELRELLVTDPDPIVRANAARVLGATEDKEAFAALVKALGDPDERVRVSAIRSLGLLKDSRATAPLLDFGNKLLARVRGHSTKNDGLPTEINEINEIAISLGRLVPGSDDAAVVAWLRQVRDRTHLASPEVEIAYARVTPLQYVKEVSNFHGSEVRRSWSNIAQALGELAATKPSGTDAMSERKSAVAELRRMIQVSQIISEPAGMPRSAAPDILRAFAAFKESDSAEVLAPFLNEKDVVLRATAAELLGELPPSTSITKALIAALPVALQDQDLNDAALAIVGSLGKQKTAEANDAIKTALDAADIQVRRRAVAVLKANSSGDFSARIGKVQTRNSDSDYRRALSRIGKQVRATVTTSKGTFVIEFIPAEAPLTVDNFVMLARRGYFNGQIVPRVVPNFVIQTGDPRGDQNGGPGYSIRCEINEVPYERGAVGMALSGKDTGGSQWFVTHSPQPHLDGGYTVFGQVVSGMDVVDRIVRDDLVRSISITETVSTRHAQHAKRK